MGGAATPELVAELQAILADELACCRRLAPLLDAERTAAAAYDHAGLLACLKEREAVQHDWHRVALRRRERLRTSGVTLAVLGAADPALAALVVEVRREAEAVRRAQGVNAGLVGAALAHVTDLLSVLKREAPDTRYDQRAAITGGVPAGAGGGWSA